MTGFEAIVLTILIGLSVIGIYALVYDWRERWRLRQKEKKLKRLLAGRPLEEVLAEAPYEYAHFQGEDGYRLYDMREDDGFKGFVYTPLDAHVWILERYLGKKED